jgi:hypothetical protein
MEEPSKSLPMGSNRPPNTSARNTSATAKKDRLFSGRAKPSPSAALLFPKAVYRGVAVTVIS